jgi:5-methylcytosine-specific restriction protein A
LIAQRRQTRLPDLDSKALANANLDELRRVALMEARDVSAAHSTTTLYRARSEAIRRYTLSRARGICEGCETAAPFRSAGGSPYLEPHHTTRLADNGPDHPARVIALCPNCHRRAHHSEDAAMFNRRLTRKLKKMEAK